MHVDTASLRVTNSSPPAGWTQHTYKLRPGPFRYAWHQRRLDDDLVAGRASLTAGSRMIATLAPDVLHLGIYKLRGGRFMHVEGPWDDLCSVTLGGGLWEATVESDSEGLILLTEGALAKRLLAIVRRSAAFAIEQQQGGNQSFVHVPSAETRHLAKLIYAALQESGTARRESITEALPAAVEQILPQLLPLAAELPVPRNQRRLLALEYERRILESLPLKGRMSDVHAETCAALGLTRRSLQLAVREHFGLSCEALQRIIRLNAAHLLLSTATDARNVTDAALATGFGHLGRFSQQYRELFGEAPSETRAAAAAF